jgi:uncharacterized protein involved in exopolysaccharide biosynthesis
MEQHVNTKSPGFDEIDLKEIIHIIWHKKLFIFGISIISLIIAGIIAFVSKPAFESTAKLITKTPGSRGGNGLSQLASLAGVNLGNSSAEVDPSEYLPDVIKDYDFTQSILQKKWLNMGDSLHLYQLLKMQPDTTQINWRLVFEKQIADDFRRENHITLSKDTKTGILTLSTVFPTQQLAYDVNKYCLELLNQYIQNSMKSQAKDKRQFIEHRLNEVKNELTNNENHLVAFKDRNVNISSPKAYLEEQRLVREIEFSQQIYIELQKQYEMARIQELNDLPLIEVIQQPEKPIVRTKPARKQIIIIGLLVGLFSGIILAFFDHWCSANFNNYNNFVLIRKLKY